MKCIPTVLAVCIASTFCRAQSVSNSPAEVLRQQAGQPHPGMALWKDDAAIATPYKPVLTVDEKIAGLSKFWSEARFNFAFFARVPDVDWDRTYMEYLPQVRAAPTTADYYRVMMRFAATLHDGHTGVWPPKELYGNFYAGPALQTALIEGKVLITGVPDPTLKAQGIQVGMEIVSIDDKPVHEYAESNIAPYISSSTRQDRDVRMYGYQLLVGSMNVPMRLILRQENGETKSITVRRDGKGYNIASTKFTILPGNIAYLPVNEFEDDRGAKTMRDNFALISQAKGLIIDVRRNGGGDSANANALLSMLSDKPFQTSSDKTLDYKAAYRAWGLPPKWWNVPPDVVRPDTAHFFSKPVIVLTSAATFSAAEDFVVAFDAMHRGLLVGETTAGSTGQPFSFKLPGGGGARICTKDDAYPDGKVFEGIGVIPQVIVAPTISDIREGRDGALERAVKILGKGSPTDENWK